MWLEYKDNFAAWPRLENLSRHGSGRPLSKVSYLSSLLTTCLMNATGAVRIDKPLYWLSIQQEKNISLLTAVRLSLSINILNMSFWFIIASYASASSFFCSPQEGCVSCTLLPNWARFLWSFDFMIGKLFQHLLNKFTAISSMLQIGAKLRLFVIVDTRPMQADISHKIVSC